jgi:DNA-binding FadR family transcriptional regulator
MAHSRCSPLQRAANRSAHRNFHCAIYVASHSPLLIDILEGLWDQADQYRQIGLQNQQDSSADQDRVQQEHVQIAETVIAGQAARALKSCSGTSLEAWPTRFDRAVPGAGRS